MLINIDAAKVKEPTAKGLSKTTADGVPTKSKNCPNTWTKRSKQKQKVKQQKEGLCIFLKGQRTATKLEANKYRRRVALDLLTALSSGSHAAIQENPNP